jgi:hypothetical protein
MGSTTTEPAAAQRRVILVFVLSTLASVVFVAAALHVAVQRAMTAQYRARLEARAGLIATACETEMDEARRDLAFVAASPAFRQLSSLDRIASALHGVPEDIEVEKRQVLTGLLAKAERFSVLYVLTTNADIYLVGIFGDVSSHFTVELAGG